jgi:cephalosporin hydroxylase
VSKSRDGDTIVEVGSYKGQSALFMAEEIRNSGKAIYFFAVDHFKGSEEHSEKDFLNQFIVNVSPMSTWIRPVVADSFTASKEFPDNHAFFVFIDASHDYESVKADIEAWLPKVKKGGYLAGHDWHHEPIKRAVADTIGQVDEYVGDCWITKI